MSRTLIHMPRRLLLATALAGLSTVALAQEAAPVADASAPVAAPAAAQHRPGAPEQWHERMAQRRAHRMAGLKAALAITPEQESAWNQFQAAMQPPEEHPGERGQRREWAKLTTPERIDRMEQRMAERQQRVKQIGEAVKAFYAQLTPQQQKTFDQRATHFGAEHAGRFGWHGQRGDGAAQPVPHVRHHLLHKPEAAASQVN